MNRREMLLALLQEQLNSVGYNVCGAKELPSVVSHCGFPIVVVGEPAMVAGGAAEATTVAYDVAIKMLMQREKQADKCAPLLALIEQDALQVAERLAEQAEVLSVVVRELAPIAGGLTHAGDVAMSLALRVELF